MNYKLVILVIFTKVMAVEGMHTPRAIPKSSNAINAEGSFAI
jgi:hypothetical protein